jgi:hypothetical protein
VEQNADFIVEQLNSLSLFCVSSLQPFARNAHMLSQTTVIETLQSTTAAMGTIAVALVFSENTSLKCSW